MSNVDVQTRFAEGINSGDFAIFDTVVSAACIDHDPAPGQGPGAQGYKDLFGDLRTAFPDLHAEPVHLVATGDDVAFAYTLTGTNTGPFQGHAPTGKAIEVRGMQISRFADDVMVERWGSTDELGIMKQLGLL